MTSRSVASRRVRECGDKHPLHAISTKIGILKSCSTCECGLGADRLGWGGLKQIKRGIILVEPNPNTTIAAEIVAAYVSNNSIAVTDLPALIGEVHSALQRIANGQTDRTPVAANLAPAVPIRKSVTPDFIICLEDGKKFRSLKRHLKTSFGMTPDEYRAKWSLPPDYPIVAPNYAAQRSALAKASGLGQASTRAARKKRRA